MVSFAAVSTRNSDSDVQARLPQDEFGMCLAARMRGLHPLPSSRARYTLIQLARPLSASSLSERTLLACHSVDVAHFQYDLPIYYMPRRHLHVSIGFEGVPVLRNLSVRVWSSCGGVARDARYGPAELRLSAGVVQARTGRQGVRACAVAGMELRRAGKPVPLLSVFLGPGASSVQLLQEQRGRNGQDGFWNTASQPAGQRMTLWNPVHHFYHICLRSLPVVFLSIPPLLSGIPLSRPKLPIALGCRTSRTDLLSLSVSAQNHDRFSLSSFYRIYCTHIQ